MSKSDQRVKRSDRREDEERRVRERRDGERREGERRLDTCPACFRILNAKGYCYYCKTRVVKIN
ncbi:MAG: hypothetical protein HY036_11740 [Nitrospirae bacterium]|nr:hypothetical protein [Nitrospirota bacterium]MBI3353233.1 hypothetical protein [Nitrospirota bacterium]